MASLAEIARISGVSIGAASKALSGKTGVSEATRQRVRGIAAQYNYRPNRLVHAIQSGRSRTVGLTCNDFRDDFAGRIVEGMLAALHAAEYDAIVISWDMCVRKEETVLRTFAERRVDGLLMFPPADQPSSAYLHELECFRRPIVVVDQTFAGVEDYDFVGSQDFEGGVLATEHLLALGHRDIANFYFSKTSTGRARLGGFRSAMRRHGIAVQERWLYGIQRYDTDEVYRQARAYFGQARSPSAVLAFNDWVALDVMAAVRDSGRRVPKDVSVIGFADLKMAAKIRPRLTTVAQDPIAIGRRAAERLLARVEGAVDATNRPACDRIPVRLVERDSCVSLTPAIPAEREAHPAAALG